MFLGDFRVGDRAEFVCFLFFFSRVCLVLSGIILSSSSSFSSPYSSSSSLIPFASPLLIRLPLYFRCISFAFYFFPSPNIICLIFPYHHLIPFFSYLFPLSKYHLPNISFPFLNATCLILLSHYIIKPQIYFPFLNTTYFFFFPFHNTSFSRRTTSGRTSGLCLASS